VTILVNFIHGILIFYKFDICKLFDFFVDFERLPQTLHDTYILDHRYHLSDFLQVVDTCFEPNKISGLAYLKIVLRFEHSMDSHCLVAQNEDDFGEESFDFSVSGLNDLLE
jgi:hypothetical protein